MNVIRIGLAAALVGAAAILGLEARAAGTDILDATLGEAQAKTAEVSTRQMRDILAARSALVLDTRTRAEFEAGHIPGARNLEAAPPGLVAEVLALAGGDKSRAMVLYCNGPYCQASRRLADQLAEAGFTDIRRYQLGIPVWRALGGPTEIGLAGVKRVFGVDGLAVFVDGRPSEDFAKGSLKGAHSMPADELVAGRLKAMPLPEDDFNRRVVLFGKDGGQARAMAEVLSKRPWHNVVYYSGSYEELAAALR